MLNFFKKLWDDTFEFRIGGLISIMN